MAKNCRNLTVVGQALESLRSGSHSIVAVNGFLSLKISSSVTFRAAIESRRIGQLTHVCLDSEALKTGLDLADSHLNVVSERSG